MVSLERQNEGLSNGPKRLPSVKKHLFQICGDDITSMDAATDLAKFIISTQKVQGNGFKIKIIGESLLALEFQKPKRIDRETILFGHYQLVRKSYKELYSSIEYIQLSLDTLLN